MTKHHRLTDGDPVPNRSISPEQLNAIADKVNDERVSLVLEALGIACKCDCCDDIIIDGALGALARAANLLLGTQGPDWRAAAAQDVAALIVNNVDHPDNVTWVLDQLPPLEVTQQKPN